MVLKQRGLFDLRVRGKPRRVPGTKDSLQSGLRFTLCSCDVIQNLSALQYIHVCIHTLYVIRTMLDGWTDRKRDRLACCTVQFQVSSWCTMKHSTMNIQYTVLVLLGSNTQTANSRVQKHAQDQVLSWCPCLPFSLGVMMKVLAMLMVALGSLGASKS